MTPLQLITLRHEPCGLTEHGPREMRVSIGTSLSRHHIGQIAMRLRKLDYIDQVRGFQLGEGSSFVYRPKGKLRLSRKQADQVVFEISDYLVRHQLAVASLSVRLVDRTPKRVRQHRDCRFVYSRLGLKPPLSA